MVRPPSIDRNGMKKGAWSQDEDSKLRAYIQRYGHWNWRLLPKYAGLKRCGKSCRLRWVNYLKPGLKRGNFSKEEQELVIKLHRELGNKWSAIAEKLPGRTDNEIKNFWHTRVEKRRKPNSAAQKVAKPIKRASFIETTNSSEATYLSTSHSLPIDASLSENSSQDELELMLSGILEADAAQNECFAAAPPVFNGEEFDYPELRYNELSCSGSSYVNSWAVDDDAGRGSFWNDQSSNSGSETSSYSYSYTTPAEEEGLLGYDPLLQYFDYETNLFW